MVREELHILYSVLEELVTDCSKCVTTQTKFLRDCGEQLITVSVRRGAAHFTDYWMKGRRKSHSFQKIVAHIQWGCTILVLCNLKKQVYCLRNYTTIFKLYSCLFRTPLHILITLWRTTDVPQGSVLGIYVYCSTHSSTTWMREQSEP